MPRLKVSKIQNFVLNKILFGAIRFLAFYQHSLNFSINFDAKQSLEGGRRASSSLTKKTISKLSKHHKKLFFFQFLILVNFQDPRSQSRILAKWQSKNSLTYQNIKSLVLNLALRGHVKEKGDYRILVTLTVSENLKTKGMAILNRGRGHF